MKNFFANILMAVFSVLMCLVLFEVVLRVFFPVYAPTTTSKHEQVGLMEFDPNFGWFHKRALNTWIETQEYSTPVSINAKGLRGAEYSYTPTEGHKRILVVGDSFSFGLGVKDDETFSKRLETLFQGSGNKYDVINMGVNGYGNDQQLLLLKHEGYKYSPDIVVCQFFVGNDIVDNISAFIHGSSKPYYVMEGETLKLKNFPVSLMTLGSDVKPEPKEPKGRINIPFLKEFLQKNSYAYIFLRLRYNYLLYLTGVRSGISEEDIENGWDVTCAILREMNNLCENDKIRFLVLIVPTREQILGVESSSTQSKLKEFFIKEGIEYIDLLELMGGRKDLYFTIDSHWNREGHKEVANILFDRLR